MKEMLWRFERHGGCALGLHWLQNPVSFMWSDLLTGDCGREGLAMSKADGERMKSIPRRQIASLWVLGEVPPPSASWRSLITLSVEGVFEHGKLWRLVSHMWKVLVPLVADMGNHVCEVVEKASVARQVRLGEC